MLGDVHTSRHTPRLPCSSAMYCIVWMGLLPCTLSCFAPDPTKTCYITVLSCCQQAGDASGTGLYDTANRCWDRHAMSVIDDQLHTRLPDLIGPDEVRGTSHMHKDM